MAEQFARCPTSLSVLMGSHLYDAVAELTPLPPPDELFDRFLGWTRLPRRTPQTSNAARAFGWPTATLNAARF